MFEPITNPTLILTSKRAIRYSRIQRVQPGWKNRPQSGGVGRAGRRKARGWHKGWYKGSQKHLLVEKKAA